MRSLLLRWGVAVVVGTLWGAVVSPRPPRGTHGAKARSLVSDAAHAAPSMKAVHWLASSPDNRMSL